MSDKGFLSNVDRQVRVSIRILSRFRQLYKKHSIKQKAGLLTYYSFMAVFPLALFSMTLVNLIVPSRNVLGQHFMTAISRIIPIIGYQFFHTLHYNRPISLGLLSVLIVGLISAFAWINEFRRSLDSIWNTSARVYTHRRRLVENFIQAILLLSGILTLALLFYLNLFIIHDDWMAALSLLIACVVNSLWWYLILRRYLSHALKPKDILPSAITIGLTITLMARFGGALLSYELKHLQSLYGSFAIILGLAIWLYIITQLILIFLELNLMVKSKT